MSTKRLSTISVENRKKLLRRMQHKEKPEKRVLKPKKGKHSANPIYLSGTYTEYIIDQDDRGFFFIKKYGGGKIPSDLQSKYTNYLDCERRLIDWLEKTDKRAQSRYPGCPERRETNYTRTFLAD